MTYLMDGDDLMVDSIAERPRDERVEGEEPLWCQERIVSLVFRQKSSVRNRWLRTSVEQITVRPLEWHHLWIEALSKSEVIAVKGFADLTLQSDVG